MAIDQFKTKEEARAFIYAKKNRHFEHRFFAEGPEQITRARTFIWGGR